MFARATTKAKTNFPVVVCFNDDYQAFSMASTSHAEIVAEHAKAVSMGTRMPPVILIKEDDNGNQIVKQGSLHKESGEIKFRNMSGKNEVVLDFSPWTDANKELFVESCETSRDPRILKFTNRVPTITKINPTAITPGDMAVQAWVGSLVHSRAYLTMTLVHYLQTDISAVVDMLRESQGSKTLREDPKIWLAWYPTPKPENLSLWLDFLRGGTGYIMLDVLDAMPSHEGFYRFGTAKVVGNQEIIDLKFDDETDETESTTIQAYVHMEGEENNRAYLMPTTPLNICHPSSKWSKSNGREFHGFNSSIVAFLLPHVTQVLSGALGPVRSTMSADWQSKALDTAGSKIALRKALHRLASMNFTMVKPWAREGVPRREISKVTKPKKTLRKRKVVVSDESYEPDAVTTKPKKNLRRTKVANSTEESDTPSSTEEKKRTHDEAFITRERRNVKQKVAESVEESVEDDSEVESDGPTPERKPVGKKYPRTKPALPRKPEKPRPSPRPSSNEGDDSTEKASSPQPQSSSTPLKASAASKKGEESAHDEITPIKKKKEGPLSETNKEKQPGSEKKDAESSDDGEEDDPTPPKSSTAVIAGKSTGNAIGEATISEKLPVKPIAKKSAGEQSDVEEDEDQLDDI